MAVNATTLGDDRRRRHVALGVVLVLLALAGFANATVKRHRADALNTPASAVGEVSLSGNASSSAWYCPGPLPLAVGHDTAAIELANVSGHRVRGVLTLVSSDGTSSSHTVDLRAGTTLRTAFPTPKRAGWGSASALLDGLGVGVTEIEHGSAGAVSTACTTTISSSAAIAGGSTRGAANVALSLYDPGATPAVVNVSFATGVGTVSPPAFQGISVGGGQLVVENVGQYLAQQASVATTVESTGGRIVVGEMDSDVLARERVLSFGNGVATAEHSWYLAPAPSGGSATQSFLVLNTSARSAQVSLQTAANGTSLGAATAFRQVAAGGTVQFNLARDAGPGSLRWSEVTASNGAEIVVSRSLVIPKPLVVPTIYSGPPPTGKNKTVPRSPYQLPPTVPQGEGSASGTPLLARSWLLGGGESDHLVGEVLTLANPGSKAVHVRLRALSGDAHTIAVLQRIGTIGLAPNSVLPVDFGGLLGSSPQLTLVVEADGPVACGADLYSRGVNGSVGFNASAAIPVE